MADGLFTYLHMRNSILLIGLVIWFYDSSEKDRTITGFEEIQRAFEDVHANNRIVEPNINEFMKSVNYWLFQGFMSFFENRMKEAMDGEKEWARIPMFESAHDYDLIYKAN